MSQTPWIAELQAVLQSWRGTPYAHGQCRRGVAVDCVQFVAAVLDELYGKPVKPLERKPADLAWHNRKEAIRTASVISRRFPNLIVRDGTIEPGDVLVVRIGKSLTSAPGHAMIAGGVPNTIWHAEPTVGVCFTGLGFIHDRIVRVWRPIGKEKWQRHS